MATTQEKRLESAYWPKIALAWQHSFERLYANRVASGNEAIKKWKSAKEMFDWYIDDPDDIPDEQLRMLFCENP